ncbi:MAG: class II fumarate hydratase [Clostridiales bacterium]|nr:class II fumarate hydratase [Clostridiales bacterium]
MEYRLERDALGAVKVPTDKYWGAQTQRSLQNFAIGNELMPKEIIMAITIIKKACAVVNNRLGLLDKARFQAILNACDKILQGKYSEHFPLVVWQTGSGTQTNMNVNEVIANLASKDCQKDIHPNDQVNMSQSSNDVFSSALHISALVMLEDKLIEQIIRLISTFEKLEKDYKGIIKCGRTHLQDATPMTFSQEISGWKTMVEKSLEMIKTSKNGLSELAIGGTAIGTGINAPKGFGELVAKEINLMLNKEFISAKNKFYALSSKDALVFAHGAIKSLALDLMKIANDIRWLASGPRCGLGEITIPENEPGSSIMPGKVNPTQCEAITMIAVQVMANDNAISFASSQGNFQLNVFTPLIAYNFLQSITLLSDGIKSFNENCLQGLKPNKEKMYYNVQNSLMLSTILSPHIGYDKASEIANKAYRENITLKQACIDLGYLTKEQFDKIVQINKMI